ncbi:M23 family metallopeptidase [Aquiflexum lacus]|uniref:M23 family metallopeptidase n=1 Tax=Aquiflexum lacus TaxID=2483805 RepID=UPI0018961469|nr:M23 family metallopeptidase [Aquiflexum lacus]
MSLKKKIANWLTAKYLFVIRKEQDFSVLGSFNISFGRIIILFSFLFLLVFGFSLLMTKTILRQWFDPVYMESENTAKIIALSDMVDSLSNTVRQKDNYLSNIQRVIDGEGDFDPFLLEDTITLEATRRPESFQPSEATKSILEEFKGMPLDFTGQIEVSNNTFIETFFFSPIKGVITSVFAPQDDHFGVDIVAKENEPVKTIADGTVILSTWTLDTGYIIGIQHSNELISIYKHNSVLLKQIGDVVRGGEIISIIGNTGELTSGQHLHFELWYKGTPLNPQEFITFD